MAPDAILFGTLGAGASGSLVSNIRGVASTFIGIAVLNWMARGAEASSARNAIVLANTIGFTLAGVLDIVAVLTGAPPVELAPAVINLALAAGFAWMGRSAMAPA